MAAFAACVLLVAAPASAQAPPPPDNNAYFSLIRTEGGQPTPIGWTRLAIPAGIGSGPRHGFYADAFCNGLTKQIVIAFRRLNPIPLVNAGTYDTDRSILYGVAPREYDQDLRTFVDAVKRTAAQQTPPLSTGPDNVFVTGNSLGAYGAQVAAREFHYGGVGFAGPGIPGYRSPADRPGNFVNYLISGDPVANHAADAGIWWGGWPVAASIGDHYGRIECLGRPGNQSALQIAVTLAAAPSVDPLMASVHAIGVLALAADIGLWHLSPRYKTKLGIETLPQRRAADS
jgi:hypothetical protein